MPCVYYFNLLLIFFISDLIMNYLHHYIYALLVSVQFYQFLCAKTYWMCTFEEGRAPSSELYHRCWHFYLILLHTGRMNYYFREWNTLESPGRAFRCHILMVKLEIFFTNVLRSHARFLFFSLAFLLFMDFEIWLVMWQFLLTFY